MLKCDCGKSLPIKEATSYCVSPGVYCTERLYTCKCGNKYLEVLEPKPLARIWDIKVQEVKKFKKQPKFVQTKLI